MGSMRSNKRAAAKSQFIHLYGAKLRSDILTSVRKSNEKVQPERRVSVASAITVANRDLANTLSYSANVRYFSAIRAVNAFVALATKNKQTPQSLSNSDLLPVGHPASTRAHAMTASAFLHAQARWIAADPMIDDSVRSLVASAHAARPGSIERTHAFTRLSIVGFGKAPSYVLIDEAQPTAITAGFLVGKNSIAARRLRAQLQRRDRRGRFAFMGGGWSFNLRLPNGLFKAVSGRVVGQSGDDGVEIEVRGNRHLPDGIYTMPAGKGESVAAILSEEAVKDLPDVDVYVGTDDVFADSDDLIASRRDAPSGWSRQVTGTRGGEPSRIEWTNEETGYTVQEDLEDTFFGKPTPRELTLRRGLENEYVARGRSWGDIQKAIDKDQPEYLKKIAEFDRAEEEKKAPKPEAPRPAVPDQQYEIVEEERYFEGPFVKMVDDSGNEIYFRPEDGDGIVDAQGDGFRSVGEVPGYQGIARVRRPVGKPEDAPLMSGEDENVVDGVRLPKGRKKLKAWQEKIIGPRRPGGRYKNSYGEEYEVIDVYVNDDDQVRIVVRGEDGKIREHSTAWDPKRDKVVKEPYKYETLKERTAREERERVESEKQAKKRLKEADKALGETPELGKPSVDDIQSAIDAGEEISFMYNGKERTLKPEGMWQNPKTGMTNVYGFDKDANDKRTYTVEKMEASPSKAPKPSKAEVAEVARPIDGDSLEKRKEQIDSAIEDGASVAFNYNDKPRLFTPERTYFNGKNGKTNVVGYSRTDGEDRTFAIDDMRPIGSDLPFDLITGEPRQMFDETNEEFEKRTGLPGTKPPTGGPGEPPTAGPRPGGYDEGSIPATFDGEDVEVTLDETSPGVYNLRATKDDGEVVFDAESDDESIEDFDAEIRNNFGQDVLDFFKPGGPGEPPTAGPGEPPTGGPSDDFEERHLIDYPKSITLDDGSPGGSFELDVAFDSDRSLDQILREFNDKFPGGKATVIEEDGPGGGWPVVRYDVPKADYDRFANWYNGEDEGGPSAPSAPRDIAPGGITEIRDQIDAAINSGDKIKFMYNGKERTVRPQRMYFNPKNGNTNLVGFSEGDGEDRTFALDKIEFAAPEAEEMTPDLEFFNEEFDSMFETPEGAYKPQIFDIYEPTGRTDQASDDYTDDPEILASQFSQEELAKGLRDAVLPTDDEDATGFGFLDFNRGPERVKAEAIYEALQLSGLDAPMILAGLYDSRLDPDREQTNVERIAQQNDDMRIEPSTSPLRTEIPTTSRNEEISRAARLSTQISRVERTATVRDALADYDEQNESIKSVAERISNAFENGDDVESLFEDLYDLSISDDPDDRQAFRGYWGILMSLDGGDIMETIDREDFEQYARDESGYRYRLVDALSRKLGVDAAFDAYDELVREYGGYPEFMESRGKIIDGTNSLDAQTSGAAFYRLISAAAKPNEQTLYRVIGVNEDSIDFSMYTTEGSRFYMDARSWTTMNISDGSIASQMFMPVRDGRRRVIFEGLPGDVDSVDVSSISPFEGESEVFGFGQFEVVSVRKNRGRVSKDDEFVVQVRRVEPPSRATQAMPAPEAATEPPMSWPPVTRTYSGIENWTKIGGGTGSNPGGFYRDADGNEYYVKIPRSQSHADNETLAALLYEALGVPAAETSYGDENGELRIVSPIVPNSDPMGFFGPYNDGDQEYLDKIRDHFVIDAWLGNYDVIGYLYDDSTNIISDGNGDPIRVDPGASLMWRAQGKPKGDDRFSYDDRDLDTMRDPDINAQAASVFADTSDEQLRNAALRLRDLTPSMIDSIVDANVKSESDRKVLKDKLKARRRAILDRFNIPEGVDDPEMFPDPVPLTESMGYQAQDLLPGDITATDSFVIDKVFIDELTPKGKVSVQGYYPGHELQRKEWNATTVIDVSRGGTVPPMGDEPALHRPEKPRKPTPGAFSGRMQELLSGVETWEEAAEVIRGTEIVYFDYETTGLSTTPGDGELNRPVQLGAVKVKDGKVIDRMNVYMNPEFRLSEWSRDNLKREDGEAVTDEWLAQQISMKEAHEMFIKFAGESPILGGQYVPFDREVLERTLGEQGLELDIAGTIDSKDIAAGTLPKWSVKNPDGPMQVGKDGKRRASNSLGPVAEYLGVELNNWHRADADAEASANIVDAMLERAIDNPDTPTGLLDSEGAFEAQRLREAEYDAAYEQYKQDLAEYEMKKAIAAAWNCGGAGLTAAVGEENGPCSVPPLDDIIKAASTEGADPVDPDGVPGGDTASPSPMTDAIDVDSPESDGKDVKDPYAGEAFPPTDQQREIVDAVLTGKDTKVLALAGTGKTSTLKLIARRLKREQPNKKIIYVAFNKSIQTEAEATMPDNVESRTADSIAYRAVSKDITKKMGSKTALVKAKEIGKHFGIYGYSNEESNTKLTQFETIRLLNGVITRFANSADDEIGPQHFGFEPDAQLLDWANEIWADLKSPNGVLRVTNSHITKMWALSRPDLSRSGSGLSRPADIIFFDEAQDINPVLGKVIADQTIQTIYVGDSNQAIYGFRGAVDQLEQVDAEFELPLTKSWRFGPQIAGMGNRFLSLLGSRNRIEGGGPDGVIVEPGSMEDAQAVLVRTNSGAITEIFAEFERGRVVGVAKNFKDDLQSFNDSARYLKGEGPKPSKVHDELAEYSSWDELLKALANEEASRKVGKFIKLIDEIGFNGVDDMLSKLKIYSSSEDGLGSGGGVDLPELTLDVARTGSKGVIVEGVDYVVVGDTVSLTGKELFNKKDAAKKLGFKWDAERKRWIKSIKSDNDRLATLKQLREGMGGGGGDKIDVVVTSAHRAKGLEWDRVRIGGDFWGPKFVTDEETGEEIEVLPLPEELKLDYVAVTRAKKELDIGSLAWVYEFTKDADESTNAPEDEVPPPPPSPDAGDIIPPPPPGPVETSVSSPEPDPEPGMSGTPEAPSEIAPEEFVAPSMSDERNQDVDIVTEEPAPGESFDADDAAKIADYINELNEEADEIETNGDKQERKYAKEIRALIDILEKQRNGEASIEETIAALTEFEERVRGLKFPEKWQKQMYDGLADGARDARRFYDGSAKSGQVLGKGLPPEGNMQGFDKKGVFIRPGMRARDKWGYAGTILRYKVDGDDWGYVYFKQDIDHRDPDKVSEKSWGPRRHISVRSNKTLTLIHDGDDNSPWIDNGTTSEDKKPKKLDEQLKVLEEAKGGDGDGGLGTRPYVAPEDGGGAPAAGTTEALRENVEARSEAEAWSGEESERDDTPKADAPAGAEEPASELDNNPGKLGVSGFVVTSIAREPGAFLGIGKLKPGKTFVSKEPIRTSRDYRGDVQRAIEGENVLLVRFQTAPGTDVVFHGKPKPVEIPQALLDIAVDKEALIKSLSESHDPYEGLDFSFPAGTKFVVVQTATVEGPNVVDERGLSVLDPVTGMPKKQYTYDSVVLAVADEDESVEFPRPTEDAPDLSRDDEADVDAANIEPDWQVDTPGWDFESVMSDLYEEQGFVLVDPDTNETSDQGLEESLGLRSYQGSGFTSINGFLRSGNISSQPLGTVIDEIDKIDKLMEKAPKLPKDAVFYRMVPEDIVEAIRAYEVGDLVTDAAFTSTSSEDDIPSDYFRLEIYAPAGTTGIYVQGYLNGEDILEFSEEQEFLIDRNTTFRVVAKSQSDDGTVMSVRLAVVEQSKPDLADVVNQRVQEAEADVPEAAAGAVDSYDLPMDISSVEKLKAAVPDAKVVPTGKTDKPGGTPVFRVEVSNDRSDAVAQWYFDDEEVDASEIEEYRTEPSTAEENVEPEPVDAPEEVEDFDENEGIFKFTPEFKNVRSAFLFSFDDGGITARSYEVLDSFDRPYDPDAVGDEIDAIFEAEGVFKVMAVGYGLILAGRVEEGMHWLKTAADRADFNDEAVLNDELYFLRSGNLSNIVNNSDQSYSTAYGIDPNMARSGATGYFAQYVVEALRDQKVKKAFVKIASTDTEDLADIIRERKQRAVRGSGVEKIVDDSPLPYDETDFDAVPSIRSSIDDLTGSARPIIDSLVDGDDVEDGRITFTKEGYSKESAVLVARFKLTSWAATALEKRRLSEGSKSMWRTLNGGERIRIKKKDIDKKTGIARVDDVNSTLKEPITGILYQYDGEVNGKSFTVKVFKSDPTSVVEVGLKDNHEWESVDNKVEITFSSLNPSDEEIAEALRIAGVNDPRPMTKRDLKVLAENKLISLFGGVGDPTINLTGAARQKVLNDIQARLGVTADDVVVQVGKDGLIEMKIPREVAQKIVDQRNLQGLTHALSLSSMTSEERAATVVDVIANEFGVSLLSTQERFDLGIQYKGSSSDEDMNSGGADYVYLTMTGYDDHRTATRSDRITTLDDSVFMFYSPAETLRRLDFWANEYDYFGGRVHNDPVVNIRREGYELMVKRHLDSSTMESIYVSAELRNYILKEFHDRGITEINGIPVRDFVRLFGNADDPTEWNPGDNLVSKADASKKLTQTLSDKKIDGPKLDSALNIPNEAGTMTLLEEYSLPSYSERTLNVLAIEKGTGTLIATRQLGAKTEIWAFPKRKPGEPRKEGVLLSAAAIENLERMIDDGSISDVAVLYGRYGRYGSAGADSPIGNAEQFYTPVVQDLLKKYRSSDPKLKKQALFGLIELLKVNIPGQLRQTIYAELGDKISEIRDSATGGSAKTTSKVRKGDITNPFWVG